MKSTNGTTKKRTIRHWKTSEIQYLKNNFQSKCYQEMALHLDRSICSVASYARIILKLKRTTSVRVNSWKKEEDDFIISNYKSMTIWDIADEINRTNDAVKARINFLKFEKKITKTNQPL